MGSIIKGTCKNSGYETKDLNYGGGLENFTIWFDFPVKMANIMYKEDVLR